MTKHRQSGNLTQLDARRLQKRLQNNKQNWSEVDDIYMTIGQGIIDVGNSVNEAIRLINIVGSEGHDELVAVTNGIRRDIEAFTSDLLKIKERHKNYTGDIKDENELALCLSVFSDYSVLNDRFRAIIFNPMLTITEFLADATERANEIVAAVVAAEAQKGAVNDKPE